ncbi:MAG: OprD family outer membrane porin [Halioglobus sp.]
MKAGILIVFLLLLPQLAIAAEENSRPAVDSLSEAFAQGQIKGLLRYSAQYRDSDLHVLQDSSSPDVADEKKQQYSAIGGFLGFETAPWYNIAGGLTFYTSNPIGNNPDDRRGLGGLDESDGGQDAYNVLGEAFLKFDSGAHMLKTGRQEVSGYRFVSQSNIRMTPVTHQGTIYENSSVEDLVLKFGYINKQKERNATEFIGMVRAARVETGCGAVDANGNCSNTATRKLIRGDFDPTDYDSEGNYHGDTKDLPLVGGIYTGEKITLEAWDYYAEDFVNTVYFYGQYRFDPFAGDYAIALAAQYGDQQDVGDSVAGDIDTWFYGFSFQLNGPGMTFFTNYNEVEYNEGSYDGGTIFVRWGTPQMFNSFQVQDSELAGTKSLGAGFQYDFGRQGILPGVVMRIRYGYYDMPDKVTQADARQDRSEATFDLRYSFTRDSGFGIFTEMEGLSLQFRLAYNDYDTDLDIAAFKAIHGYEFDTITNDFIDARIYLDYHF